MHNYTGLKKEWERYTGKAKSLEEYKVGAREFAKEFHLAMGVKLAESAKDTSFHSNANGWPARRRPCLNTREISIRALAECIMGHDMVEEIYHPAGGGFNLLQEAPVDPTAFVNINTFNVVTSGLVNAEIMERFEAPEYLGRKLISIQPTRMNGHKRIGVANLAPLSAAAKGRQPGEKHVEIGLTEMYQTAPGTTEQALKCVVTREAVFFDLTGQVLETAGMVGDELAYGMEKSIADAVLGVSSADSYNLNGTSYSTYQTASPYINDQANPFSDYKDWDDSRQLLVNMKDPITSREIKISGYTILGMPPKTATFRTQLFGANVMVGTQLNSSFPSLYTNAANPIVQVGGGTITHVELSAIWYNRATASDGLNLSASDAAGLWFMGDFTKAFSWNENWPITTWQAPIDELRMKDEGLAAVYGANYRGVVWCKEPRYSIRNKVS